MNRFILTGVAVLTGCLPVLALDDGKPGLAKPSRRNTFASIRALAETAGPAMSEPDRQDVRSTVDSVRDLTDVTEPVNEEPADAPKPREPKPKARKDVRAQPPVEKAKKPAAEQAKRQVQRRLPNDLARQQGGLGFQPWVGDPWMGGWGNGIYSNNRITGYRSFRYSGYGNGYGWPYYPGYGYGNGYGYGFGFGFSPVAFSISGPVTTRYADPVGRQHKMMDESIRKFAEDPTGLSR